MNICKKCGKEFKTWIKIDGIRHNLNSRKYCLECSPFGCHNTKQFDKPVNEESIKREKQYNIDRVQKRRNELKHMSVEYKGGKCIICNYNKCFAALEFHHINPLEKDFSISRKGNTRSWEKVKTELDKCILLCANCHRELHVDLINNPL